MDDREYFFQRDLGTGGEKQVDLESLPQGIRDMVRGSQEAGCHDFTFKTPQGLRSIIWERSDKGNRKK